VGEGQPSPKNQKIAVARGTEPIRKFMQYSGYAFIFNQKGLMAGLGLQGNKITRLND
jgi:lipid-binding SYLF domain-containing protein